MYNKLLIMSTENLDEVFFKSLTKYYKLVKDDFIFHKQDNRAHLLKHKYKYLSHYRISKRTNISELKSPIYELFNDNLFIKTFIEELKNSEIKELLEPSEKYREYEEMVIDDVRKIVSELQLSNDVNKLEKNELLALIKDAEEKRIIEDVMRVKVLESCISKIVGLYKHAQALKTGYCNNQLMNGFSEPSTVSLCMTKNALEANAQWLIRLYKDLDNRFPTVKLSDKIMVISSTKNTLDGKATHFKDIHQAWSSLKKDNNFKIIFMCSNRTRIQNIYDIAESFLNLRENRRTLLRIFHDEAHNIKEGIPPYRSIIENIIVLPNVLSYQPITATIGKIVDNTNPLWIKENLESNAIDYSGFDKTKSTDPNYSSIGDYIKIPFEELQNDKWVNHDITEISRKEFIKIDDKYKNKKLEDLDEDELVDIDNRRKYEFCQMMKNDKEKEAIEKGFNFLNINNILDDNIFIPNKLNFYIISTPNRKQLTYHLCKRAQQMSYNPIVLGIYGNEKDKYHLFMDNNDDINVDNIMGKGEFNEKLYKLLCHLQQRDKVNTKRPFIIIGNYNPTGESLSYVNYHYGIMRMVCRLNSTNMEEDYQTACRGNYMTTKFIQNNPEWKMPVKYLIGDKKFIDNALAYEKENDNRIDTFEEMNDSNELNNIIISPNSKSNLLSTDGTTAIPIKFEINDPDNEKIIELIGIATKHIRSESDKHKFIELLHECCQDDDINCKYTDKSGKFNWVNMKLNDFRSYKKQQDKQPTKGNWKFKNYENNFETEQPFMNNTGNHIAGQCEILTCLDHYIIKDNEGKIIEKNYKSVWWMGYKY